MSKLSDVRAALNAGLIEAGFNVADGGDVVPPGANVGPFVVSTYHATIAGKATRLMRVQADVHVIVSRADEASAWRAIDDAMSDTGSVLEAIQGPWISLAALTAVLDTPLRVGEAEYEAVAVTIEVHV